MPPETVQEMIARRKKEKAQKEGKGEGSTAQAEALESKPPSPKPKPSPSPSSSGLVEGGEYILNNTRTGMEGRRTVKSSTPQSDEQAKIKRIQTLSDDEVLAKAKEGYVDHSVEARRRKAAGNARFKDYGDDK